jgi:hypothetical protein
MNTNKTTTLEMLFETAENCSKTTLELLKLKTIAKSADSISSLAVGSAFLVFISLFMFIISIGLSFWIGELLGKPYYGFFVIAGGYLLIAILLRTYLNKWIKVIVNNIIINILLNLKAT